jgi:hypothetical protein
VCQASCTSQHNQKSELMKELVQSTIHFTIPPLMCDERRESQHMNRRRTNTHMTKKAYTWTKRGQQEIQDKLQAYTWTKRGRGTKKFRINCENHDSNSRPCTLIPCQASCTSQCNQKSKLMERAKAIHLYTSQQCVHISLIIRSGS